MRVKGTEAESFVLAPAGRNQNQQSNHNNKKPISIGQHILQQQQQATKAATASSAKQSVKQNTEIINQIKNNYIVSSMSMTGGRKESGLA